MVGITDRSRRDFARLFAVGGSAALFAARPAAWTLPGSPAVVPPEDERGWHQVRDQFVMPPGYVCLNAANLCPSPAPVLDALTSATQLVDRDPSSQNRRKTHEGREALRRRLASCLRVTPEEVVITRNTSEANNMVSSGIDLRAGDEVVIFSDNHPSNHAAWRQKAQRFGFTVKTVQQVNPHPGPEAYIEAFRRQLTPATRLIAFTHVTASVGDLLPARELCRLAREHGALSLVDGAQSFGVLDVDLSDMQPDFYSGSAHKWPCGPKENGVLYVNARVHDRIKPTIVSLYGGEVGISRSARGVRPAGRSGDDGVRCGVAVRGADRSRRHREARPRADDAADERAENHRRRQGLDPRRSATFGSRCVVSAGGPGCQ